MLLKKSSSFFEKIQNLLFLFFFQNFPLFRNSELTSWLARIMRQLSCIAVTKTSKMSKSNILVISVHFVSVSRHGVHVQSTRSERFPTVFFIKFCILLVLQKTKNLKDPRQIFNFRPKIRKLREKLP